VYLYIFYTFSVNIESGKQSKLRDLQTAYNAAANGSLYCVV